MLDKQKLGTFVIGGIAGAVVGILFTPRSGKELRGSLAARAGEARERGRETYFEAQERVRERISEARERPRELRSTPEAVVDPSPKLGPVGLEPLPEPPAGMPAETSPDPPPLRDVSRDAPGSGVDPDPDEIRRRIQETRSRLRARLEAPEDRDV